MSIIKMGLPQISLISGSPPYFFSDSVPAGNYVPVAFISFFS
jgi:hypothetical protein